MAPHLVDVEARHLNALCRHALLALLVVVRADPHARPHRAHNLHAAGHAGDVVAAHEPGPVDGVEGVQQQGQRQGGLGQQVVGGPAGDEGRGQAVGRVEDGDCLFARGQRVWAAVGLDAGADGGRGCARSWRR